MINKAKGFDRRNSVHIGDKHLTMSNTEDASSLRIYIVDDILEVALNENFYECTCYNFNIKRNGTSYNRFFRKERRN